MAWLFSGCAHECVPVGEDGYRGGGQHGDGEIIAVVVNTGFDGLNGR